MFAESYKRQLEVICNNATLALFIMDDQQQCVYMNPAAEALTGYSLAETKGRALHDVIHHTRPDGTPYPLCECPIDQAFPKNNREQGEEVFVHKTGYFYPVAYTASPIQDGDRVIGTVIEVRDITQEKQEAQAKHAAAQREQALRREAEMARQQVENVLASIHDGMFVLDRNWCYTYVNDRLCDMAGLPRERLLGRCAWDLFPEGRGSEIEVQFQRALQTQVPVQFEHEYWPWHRWFEYRVYPSEQSITVFAAEVTDRKQTEFMLLEQTRLLKRIAAGESLDACLVAVCESVRQLNPDTRACFLLIDAQQQVFHRAIAPHFPPPFAASLTAVPIQDFCGSCATAFDQGESLSVANLAEDDRWLPVWREFCLSHGILAAYAQPVMGTDGIPLGLLWLCFPAPRPSTRWETQLAGFGAQIASIVFQRDRADLARQKSEQQYRVLFESIDEGFCICELVFNAQGTPYDYRFQMVNPAFAMITGLSNAVGKTVLELVPNLESDWIEIYANVVRTGEPVRFELQSLAMNAWYDVNAFRIGAAGSVQFGSIFTNVSDRKQTEAALRQSESRLQMVAANLPRAAVFILNHEYRYLLAEGQALQDVGLTSTDLLGKTLWEALSPDLVDQYLPYYRQTLNGIPFSWEHDSHGRTYISHGTPLSNEAGAVEAALVVSYDISDRKRIERERVRFLEVGSDLLVISGAAGYFHWVSPTFEQTLGWTAEELTTRPWIEFVHPDDVPAARVETDQLFTGQPTLAFENRLRHRDGSYRWFLWRAQPYPDEQLLYAAAVDITDLKLAEATLRESEEKSRNILESIHDGFFALNQDWQFTYVNQAAFRLLALTPNELLGRNLWEQYPGLVGTEFEHLYRTAMCDRVAGSTTSFYPDHERWYDVHTYPAADGITAYFRDVTEQIQATTALRQSEERYRTLFESIDEGFCIIEVLFDDSNTPIDYRFLETNPIFEQQTGLHQPVGKTVRQLVPDLEQFWIDTYGRVAQTGEDCRLENGSAAMNRWFDVYACRLGQPQDHKVAIVFKDISDRKRIEQEREQLLQREQAAREAAETANRIKDEFLAVLSHELRSPLNPILGWSKLLQTGKLSPERQIDAVKTIERNAKLQAQLIEDLLDISRILQGKLSLTASPVQLPAVITAAIETVRLAAEVKHIVIGVDVPVASRPVFGDAARLQQVIWNLLTNAVKFTPSGGRVEVQLTEVADQTAQITVRDTGKGINPDFLPYVFEYFRQEDGSTTRKFGGLGLGLAIVRQIVELHGGTVTVNSAGEGQGATFTVQLPLWLNAGTATRDRTEAGESAAAPTLPLAHLHILMIDDDQDTREFQTFLLEQYGARVTAVASGAAALHWLDQAMPDVIVSDVGMAEMDGYMLMQRVRSHPMYQRQPIPAIALTAYARELDQQKAMQAGFQRHLTKPVEAQQLLEAIMAIVDSTSERSPGLD
jgi:PAS domain S-box-containing protein